MKLFDSWIECFLGTFTIYATNKYLPHCSINVTKKKCHFIFMFYSPFDKNNLMQALNKNWHFIALSVHIFCFKKQMDWIWYFCLSFKQWSRTGAIIGMWCHFRNDGMTLMVFDIKTQFCYSVYKLINTSRTLSHLSKIVCWHRPFPIVQWRKTSLLALLGGLLKR